MNPYRLDGPFQKGNKLFWRVHEKRSGVTIPFESEERAADFIAFASRGGAFDGFTPQFMLIAVSHTDYQQKIKAEFIVSE